MLHECDKIRCCEWRISCSKLIKYHTKTPQICSMIVGLLFNNLWSHIKRCSFQRRQNFSFVAHGTSESKITKFNYTIACHKNVLRLHVSVCNSVRVNVMKRPDKLLCNFSYFFNL